MIFYTEIFQAGCTTEFVHDVATHVKKHFKLIV